MKHHIKVFTKFLAATFIKFIYTFISLFKVLASSKYNVSIKSINDKGKCYILGNGPSLKGDLADNFILLKSNKLFVVNNFAKSDYYIKLKPQYYVFADPAYWSTEENSIVRNCKLTLEMIKDNTEWEMKIFVPFVALKNIWFRDFFKSNKNITLVTFNTTFICDKGFEYSTLFFYKNNLAAPRIQNVLMSAIFISINIGLSEINILGSDHGWTKELFVNGENQVCIYENHFYDKEKKDFNVFKRLDGTVYKMHEILRDFAFMFEGYHLLKKYGNDLGVKIYNRTTDSFIDAFERKNLNNS